MRTRAQTDLNASAADAAFEDWRFAHPMPAALISVNIMSLVRSPIWTIVFPALGASDSAWTADDLNKARAALSDIGQVLVSVAGNGSAGPSMLILARGNVDGALRSLLRPGDGMQAQRLNAITMLMGDPRSMEFANLRLRSPFTPSALGRMHQEAREALKYDLWLGLEPSHLASLVSAHGGSPNPALNMLGNMRGISVGIYLRDQVRIEASLEAPSPETAQRILGAFQQMQAKKQESGKDPFGGQVWFSAEGSQVRMIEIIEGSQLKAIPGLDVVAAQMVGPQIAAAIRSLAAMGAQQPAAAVSTGQGSIVIQGR